LHDDLDGLVVINLHLQIRYPAVEIRIDTFCFCVLKECCDMKEKKDMSWWWWQLLQA